MPDVRVFFATNRNHQPGNKKEAFGPRFNPDGVAALRFGHADFNRGKTGPTLAGVTVYPENVEGGVVQGGSDRFLDGLRTVMAGERSDTLVFVHGYNVSFTSALKAGALLAEQVKITEPDGSARPVNVVVFSWPSDGQMIPHMSYYSDREDARASGPALARAYLKLRDYLVQLDRESYCQRCLHLLTHSMGAYVLRNGLQALIAKDSSALTRLFDQILLAAPDEDDDAFETDQKLRLLPRLGRQVTIYFNPHDRALVISDKTKSNPDRLGSDGPRLVDLLPKKVELVDCRHVGLHADPLVGHSYYVNSPAVSYDISQVLFGIEPDRIGNRQFIANARAWRLLGDLGAAPPAATRPVLEPVG